MYEISKCFYSPRPEKRKRKRKRKREDIDKMNNEKGFRKKVEIYNFSKA